MWVWMSTIGLEAIIRSAGGSLLRILQFTWDSNVKET